MSFTSPQQATSAEASQYASQVSTNLLNISLPEISSTLNSAFSQIQGANANGGIPQSVRDQYDPIIAQTNQDYKSAGAGQSAYIKQAALQGGNQMSGAGIQSALSQAGMNLEQSRRQSQQNIAYSEATAGLAEYNQLLDVMGQGSGLAIGEAGSSLGLGSSALGYLNTQSLGGSVLGGASTGASLGGSVGGGWGALIGGVLGGAFGYGSYES